MDDLTNGLMALLTEDGSGTFSQLLDMSDRFCREYPIFCV